MSPEVRNTRFRAAGIVGAAVLAAAVVARLTLAALGHLSTEMAGALDVAIFGVAGIGSLLSTLRLPAPRRFFGILAAVCLLALAVHAFVRLV